MLGLQVLRTASEQRGCIAMLSPASGVGFEQSPPYHCHQLQVMAKIAVGGNLVTMSSVAFAWW